MRYSFQYDYCRKIVVGGRVFTTKIYASIILPETVRTCHKSTVDHIQAFGGFCIKRFVKVYVKYESPISTCGRAGVIGNIAD